MVGQEEVKRQKAVGAKVANTVACVADETKPRYSPTDYTGV